MSDCLDDSYDIPSVPRFAILGASDDENDVNKTLGDRFFDFPHLQTNTVGKKANEERIIKDHPDFHKINGSAKQSNKSDMKKDAHEEVVANAMMNGAPKAAEERMPQKRPSCVSSRRSLFGNSRHRSQSGTRISTVNVKPKVNTFLPSRMRSASCENRQVKKQTLNHGDGVRQESYIGPETRARSKLKSGSTAVSNIQRPIGTTSGLKNSSNQRKSTSGQATVSQSKVVKSASVTKLPQTHTPKLRIDNSAANGHISRPRSRFATGPVRVDPIAGSLLKGKDKASVAELETESEFRRSIRSRMKGGASMERQSSVTRDECSKSEPRKRASVNKPIEFAPCMRTRATAVQAAKLAGAVTPLKSRDDGANGFIKAMMSPKAAPKRRTAADREAFFRRLSTPKSITSGRKVV